jgi:hypothetical protein
MQPSASNPKNKTRRGDHLYEVRESVWLVRGTGTFFRKKFTTVGNHFGIAVGIQVDVTLYIVTSSSEFKAQLSPSMKSLICPSSPPSSSEFVSFPHYPSKVLTKAEVNLLASFVGRTVHVCACLHEGCRTIY